MGLEARLEKLERLMGQRDELLVIYTERYLDDADVIGLAVNEDDFYERVTGEDLDSLRSRVETELTKKNKLGGVFVISAATERGSP